MDFYPKLPPESQAQLKEQVLLAIQQSQSVQMRHKVCELAAEVARNLIDDDGNNQWPEFLQVKRFYYLFAFSYGFKIMKPVL